MKLDLTTILIGSALVMGGVLVYFKFIRPAAGHEYPAPFPGTPIPPHMIPPGQPGNNPSPGNPTPPYPDSVPMPTPAPSNPIKAAFARMRRY